MPVEEEPAIAKESKGVEEPIAVEEKIAEEPPAVEEAVVIEEPATVEEPAVVKERVDTDHIDSSRDLYWQKIPLWKDATEQDFIRYSWQVCENHP